MKNGGLVTELKINTEIKNKHELIPLEIILIEERLTTNMSCMIYECEFLKSLPDIIKWILKM